MWISRKDYDELLSSKFFWEKAYNDRLGHVNELLVEANIKIQNMNLLRTENVKLKEQVEEYKQKYADEVNKRLELIEYYEKNNSKAMGASPMGEG